MFELHKTHHRRIAECESLYLCFALMLVFVEWCWCRQRWWWWWWWRQNSFFSFHSFIHFACAACSVSYTTKNQIIIVYIMIVGYVCPFTFHACCLCCCRCVAYARIFFCSPFVVHIFVSLSLHATEEPDTRCCRRRRRLQQRRPSSPHHQRHAFSFSRFSRYSAMWRVVENIQIHSGADDKRDFLCWQQCLQNTAVCEWERMCLRIVYRCMMMTINGVYDVLHSHSMRQNNNEDKSESKKPRERERENNHSEGKKIHTRTQETRQAYGQCLYK